MGDAVGVAGGDAPASLLECGVKADGVGGVEQQNFGVMPNRQAQIADTAGVGELHRKTGMAAHLDRLATSAREACANQSRDPLGRRDL